MATLGKPMDPESYKRERSGFWKRHVDLAQDIETWTCDKRKLNDAISRAMLDPIFAREFHTQGSRILDKLWGEGTAEAFSYRTKGDQDRVCMKINPFMRENEMALGYYGTSTNTIATTTSSGTSHYYDNRFLDVRANIDEAQRQLRRQAEDTILREGKKLASKTFRKKLVRNMPFVCGKGDLVPTLQREFDHWAGDQMKVLYG